MARPFARMSDSTPDSIGPRIAKVRVMPSSAEAPAQGGADSFAEGGCDCRFVRYRLATAPMFVHCCHCRWCQRETGSAFALNAMIEAERVATLAGETEAVMTPSASGKGQRIVRCPRCRIALWSHYAGAGDTICFVRVGTLDEPDRCPPDIHIFTASKQHWVLLPDGVPAFTEYYRASEVWPAASLERRARLRAAQPRRAD